MGHARTRGAAVRLRKAVPATNQRVEVGERTVIGARWVAARLAMHAQIDREMTRGSGTSAKRNWRRSECRHDEVGVGEVPRVCGDLPPAMAGPVFDAGAEQSIRS